MPEIKNRCISANRSEPWGVVDAVNSSYNIRDVDAGEIDDILSVTSSDMEDSAVLQGKKPSAGTMSDKDATENADVDLGQRKSGGARGDKRIPKGVLVNKLHAIVLGISLLAGLINVGILTVFMRDMASYAKSHPTELDAQCGSLDLKDRLFCQFDAYMDHRAHRYEKSRVGSPLVSTQSRYLNAISEKLSQRRSQIMSIVGATEQTTHEWWVFACESAQSHKRHLYHPLKNWTLNTTHEVEDRISTVLARSKQFVESYKRDRWPTQQRVLKGVMTDVLQDSKKLLNMISAAACKVERQVPRAYRLTARTVTKNYNNILDLLRFR